MKKLYSILVITLIMIMGNTFNIIAQAPERFTYQGEARDSRGRILDNKSLTIRASILNGPTASTGTVSWRKDLTAKTDCYGLFTLQIGDAPGETAFASINWGTGKYYLNIQILNGKYWLDMGTTQLLSVPYALYAKSAGSAGNETDPVFKASPSFGITTANTSNWNSAFSWGNHGLAGYLKSYTETDPLWSASPSFGITSTNISNWNTAYNWG
ncbi:MAG: hypothetical protein NTV01_07190, partial [Bacteroidia bacterium]|nr:hypothetical protein [Bacteroidia bacterium]